VTGVAWLVALVCIVSGLTFLVCCAHIARREVDPTQRSIDGFGRALRPVLLRVRDETDRTRRRLDRET